MKELIKEKTEELLKTVVTLLVIQIFSFSDTLAIFVVKFFLDVLKVLIRNMSGSFAKHSHYRTEG